MSKRERGERLSPFVPLLKSTLASPAWRAMSHGARSLYAALKAFYNPNSHNNPPGLFPVTKAGPSRPRPESHVRGPTLFWDSFPDFVFWIFLGSRNSEFFGLAASSNSLLPVGRSAS
jgi:hypothetical protein